MPLKIVCYLFPESQRKKNENGIMMSKLLSCYLNGYGHSDLENEILFRNFAVVYMIVEF